MEFFFSLPACLLVVCLLIMLPNIAIQVLPRLINQVHHQETEIPPQNGS